jgi:phosphoglycolate phosphatase-like HAD superfamily hydrolase
MKDPEGERVVLFRELRRIFKTRGLGEIREGIDAGELEVSSEELQNVYEALLPHAIIETRVPQDFEKARDRLVEVSKRLMAFVMQKAAEVLETIEEKIG